MSEIQIRPGPGAGAGGSLGGGSVGPIFPGSYRLSGRDTWERVTGIPRAGVLSGLISSARSGGSTAASGGAGGAKGKGGAPGREVRGVFFGPGGATIRGKYPGSGRHSSFAGKIAAGNPFIVTRGFFRKFREIQRGTGVPGTGVVVGTSQTPSELSNSIPSAFESPVFTSSLSIAQSTAPVNPSPVPEAAGLFSPQTRATHVIAGIDQAPAKGLRSLEEEPPKERLEEPKSPNAGTGLIVAGVAVLAVFILVKGL